MPIRRLIGLISLFISLGGCSGPSPPVATPPAPDQSAANPIDALDTSLPTDEDIEPAVFRGKLYKATACIEQDGVRALYKTDGFEVVEVVQGELREKQISIHPFGLLNQAYPKDLTVGDVYVMKLTPSNSTKKQIIKNRDRNPDDRATLWVGAEELQLEQE